MTSCTEIGYCPFNVFRIPTICWIKPTKILLTAFFTFFFFPFCLLRTMQDMENPQVTSCNKGDQHYRSSPSNQSSSSDPGPCGSSGWSQQPGYDGYGTTVCVWGGSPSFPSVVPPGICGFRVMNAAPISFCAFPVISQFCQMTAIFSHTKWPNHQCTFCHLPLFFFCRKGCDKRIKLCLPWSNTTFSAQNRNNEGGWWWWEAFFCFFLFSKYSLLFFVFSQLKVLVWWLVSKAI